jgi:hypothetical protein
MESKHLRWWDSFLDQVSITLLSFLMSSIIKNTNYFKKKMKEAYFKNIMINKKERVIQMVFQIPIFAYVIGYDF